MVSYFGFVVIRCATVATSPFGEVMTALAVSQSVERGRPITGLPLSDC